MRMQILRFALAALALLACTPAFGQSLSDDMVQSGWTRERAQQMIRSNAALSATVEDQARALGVFSTVIENLAVEALQANPGQSAEFYVDLLQDIAPTLPAAIAAARALDPENDPVLADLQQRAVAAAEQGLLREARALMDQWDAAYVAAEQRRVEAFALNRAEGLAISARFAFAAGDFLDAAARYQRAYETAPEVAEEVRWRYAIGWASARSERGNRFPGEGAMQDAVRIYETIALLNAPRDGRPDDWATTLNELGNALSILGQRGEPGALQRAVITYEASLTVRTEEVDPNGWAQTQMNRGNALLLLGMFGQAGAVEQAVEAYEAALIVFTQEADPFGWGQTQINLGAALTILGERGQLDALGRAVQAYEAALTVFNPRNDPFYWGMAQNNLGAALRMLAERGQADALQRAVEAFEAALTVSAPESDPVGWAQTQVNLGTALVVLGERGQAGAIERAVAAYEAALAVLTKEADPVGWAVTQNNLGNALQALGEQGQTGALERAVEAYLAALTVRSRDADPSGWASTQMNLGTALSQLGEGGQGGALEQAVQAYEAALTVHTQETNPTGWARATYNLALTYRVLGRIAESRTAAQGALEVYEQVGDDYGADQARAFLAALPPG